MNTGETQKVRLLKKQTDFERKAGYLDAMLPANPGSDTVFHVNSPVSKKDRKAPFPVNGMGDNEEFVSSSNPGFLLRSTFLLEPLIDPPHLGIVPHCG